MMATRTGRTNFDFSIDSGHALCYSADMRTQACRHCNGTGRIVSAEASEIREARKAAGLSQAGLAARIGQLFGSYYSGAYISDLERGRRNLGPAIVHKWMTACQEEHELVNYPS